MVEQPWGKVLVPPQEVCITICFSCAELRSPPLEVGNFWLNSRFLVHHTIPGATTCPTTNQKIVIHLETLTPNFGFLSWAP